MGVHRPGRYPANEIETRPAHAPQFVGLDARTPATRSHRRTGSGGRGGPAGIVRSPAPARAPGWQGVRIGHHWRLLVPLAGPVRLRFIVNTSACRPRPDRGCGEPSCSSALSAHWRRCRSLATPDLTQAHRLGARRGWGQVHGAGGEGQAQEAIPARARHDDLRRHQTASQNRRGVMPLRS